MQGVGVGNDSPGQEVESRVLALLRQKGLSIKNLSAKDKAEVTAVLRNLHIERGVSLGDIAVLLGNKTSGYTSWLCKQLGITARPFEEARLKGVREKRRKYERRPFQGTVEERAYLLGLRHGDLSVSRPWTGVVRVSTSTTHPAMAELFHSLFGRYGHIYEHPRYKEDTRSYEWNLSAILDSSFEFLFPRISALRDWILSQPSITVSYLAGLFDAEGSVGIYPAKRHTSLTVTYYNTDLDLLRFVHDAIGLLGFNPLLPYLDKKRGSRSPGYKIELKKDYWRVQVCRFEDSLGLLRSLPMRHREKIAKKALALTLSIGEPWSAVGPKVESVRASINAERDGFVAKAEAAFRVGHPGILPSGQDRT